MQMYVNIGDSLQRSAWEAGVYRRKRGLAEVHAHESVAQICQIFKIRDITDFGAGLGRLGEALSHIHRLRVNYKPVDVAFPEDGVPEPAELVTAIEVLEHIEPEKVEETIKFLASLIRRFGYFTIATGPHGRVLEDGRDAHLVQEPTSWWLPRLCKDFNVVYLHPTRSGFAVLVVPRRVEVARDYVVLQHVLHSRYVWWRTQSSLLRLALAGLRIKLRRLDKP